MKPAKGGSGSGSGSGAAVMALAADLVESKQEAALDEPMVEKLVDAEELSHSEHKRVRCEVDATTRELVWDSGCVWFKKDWSVLVGAWADPDNNLIEIRANHSIRYIDGDGSVEGEFVGFKKLRVKLPNGKTMTANMLHNKELLLENGEKWTRCTDKGCLIM